MTRQAAKAFYDVQAGDPATGYITPADAQAALDVVYDDMAASSVPRITGSPEGVRAGNPGDEVIQTNATTDVKGWIRWIKATGTGNTGWIAGPEADTGWRDLSAGVLSGWTAARIRLRRIGRQVYMVGNVNGTAATADDIAAIPLGFRTDSGQRFFGAGAQNGSAVVPVEANGNNDNLRSTSRENNIFFSVTWITPNAWPSALPGVLSATLIA